MRFIFIVIKMSFILSNNKGSYAMTMLSAWEMLWCFVQFYWYQLLVFVFNQTIPVHT